MALDRSEKSTGHRMCRKPGIALLQSKDDYIRYILAGAFARTGVMNSDSTYVTDLGDILKLNIALVERATILDAQVFWLNRAGRIENARWNAVETEPLED